MYTHAHAYGVPYFKDSTPEWSTRGKLRNQVQPLLGDVYGEGYASHLTVLARESAECTELLEAALLGPLLLSLHESPLAVWLDTAAWSHLTLPLALPLTLTLALPLPLTLARQRGANCLSSSGGRRCAASARGGLAWG